MADSNPLLKPCKWCKVNIDNGARRCPHCQSSQGIWAKLAQLNVLLVLLVASATLVMSFGLPAWKRLNSVDDSIVQAELLSSFPHLRIRNTGTREAIVQSVTAKFVGLSESGDEQYNSYHLPFSNSFYRLPIDIAALSEETVSGNGAST